MEKQLRVRQIVLPYHNGLADMGMGLGSRMLAQDEETQRDLESIGWSLSRRTIPPVDECKPEIARVIELIRRLAAEVEETTSEDAFPLVLAGSCLGTVAGVGAADIGVVWFDAHADFDTPDDNLSGFFDVMGLAMLTGSGWNALTRTIPGFSPVNEANVVLATVRDLAPYQRDRLMKSRVRIAPGDLSDGTFDAHLNDLATRVTDVYLHLDLDSIDSSEGTANQYAAPGGPGLRRLIRAIDEVFDRFNVRAPAVTAYDPAFDEDGMVRAAARALLQTVGQRAYEQRRR